MLFIAVSPLCWPARGVELDEAIMTTPRATQRALIEVRPDDITTDYAVSEANEQWGRGRLSPPPTLSIICVMSGGPQGLPDKF